MSNETNIVEGIAVAISAPDVAEAREPFSLSDARSIAAQLDGKEAPNAMDSALSDFQIAVAGIEQIRESTQLNEYIENIEKRGGYPANNDKDGDGIPDDYDKYQGRSIADVAAEKYGLGKYRITQKMKSMISALKNLSKNLKMVLSTLALIASIAKAMKNCRSKDRDESDGEDGKPFAKGGAEDE
ncbi:MAG: hypothetical protein LBI61_00065 [Puniceicoccales bacterium]|nr:hypothetical protein [Puniceicoccales bacterium]